MKKILMLLAVALLVSSGTAAMAAMSWDFQTGMQGWAWSTANAKSVPGEWIGGPPPELVAGTGIYGVGGGNLFLPGDGNSRSTAEFDLSPYLTGGSTQSFFLQADVYIPNLLPLTGFNHGYPGNMNHFSGITMLPTTSTTWGTSLLGRVDKGGQMFVDYTGNSFAERRKDWVMEDFTGGSYNPESGWWNQWITLQIDWNYSVADNAIAKAYIPWQMYNAPAGWITLYSGAIEAATWQGPRPTEFSKIALGSNLNSAGTPWSKSQYDNVIFDSPDLIPEPAGLMSLGVGLVGLVGALRRRKA